MTAAVIVLGVVVLALIAALYLSARDRSRNVEAILHQAYVERSELATRIQHPQVFVRPQSEPAPAAEVSEPADAEAYASIGRVMPLRSDVTNDG